jgi:cation diffusion facilitator CzcD-associated flavoprotein CzcO
VEDRSSKTPADPELDVVIIGAGFSGLYMLHKARNELGLKARIFESAPGPGGTWYWNTYPGARCDSESYVYCYSFSEELLQEWEWSRRYPSQGEILAYLNHVTDRFDLRRDIRFNTRVTAAHFDDRRECWTIETSEGESTTAKYLVSALGLLAAAPYTPKFPGLESYRGEWYHTGEWPQDGVDLKGRRVAVIGTGSTGVQVIPEIAPIVDKLYVFQRTPQYTIPARNEPMDPEFYSWVKKHYNDIWERARWSAGGFPWQHNGRSALEVSEDEREETFWELWNEGGFKFLWGSYKDILTNIEANDLAADFIRKRICERVDDQSVAEKLLPLDHPFGSRRPIVDTGYFETFNRANVELVDLRESPIVRATPDGIETELEDYQTDVIIFATGFDAVTGPYSRIDIRGRHGLELGHKWRYGPKTYLGLANSDFPNMFMITGPGSMFGNHPVTMEHHVEWIGNCIEYMERHNIGTIEPTEDAETDWYQQIEEQASRTVASLADSWWTGGNIPGKPRTVLFYLGNYGVYRRTCEDIAEQDYQGFKFTTQ